MNEEFGKLKVNQLKAKLKEVGAPTTGRKKDLFERLILQ